MQSHLASQTTHSPHGKPALPISPRALATKAPLLYRGKPVSLSSRDSVEAGSSNSSLEPRSSSFASTLLSTDATARPESVANVGVAKRTKIEIRMALLDIRLPLYNDIRFTVLCYYLQCCFIHDICIIHDSCVIHDRHEHSFFCRSVFTIFLCRNSGLCRICRNSGLCHNSSIIG